MVARRAHNPEVVGSSPASATRKEKAIPLGWLCSFLRLMKQVLHRPPGSRRGASRPLPVAGRGRRASGRGRWGTKVLCRRGHPPLTPTGRRFESCLRNQHCEPKKISVQKTPKPQFRGFVMPFFKVKFKRYHFPKTTFGEDLNYMSEQYWVEKAIII